MSRVYVIFGEPGTGKTTWALSGAKPVHYFEFDSGSFARAAEALRLSEGDVDLYQYPAPLTNLMDPGKLAVGQRGGYAPITGHTLSGWMDIFWGFVKDYLDALAQPGYAVIDTDTKFYLADRQAFLEQVQEAVGVESDRLNALQYTEPLARKSQVMDAARQKNRDLILIAHEKEVYLNDKPTGQLIPDTHKETVAVADCVLRFSLRDRKPVATIYKAGTGGLELIGREIEEPTIGSVTAILDAAAKVRRAGMPIPDSNSDLLELAEGLG